MWLSARYELLVAFGSFHGCNKGNLMVSLLDCIQEAWHLSSWTKLRLVSSGTKDKSRVCTCAFGPSRWSARRYRGRGQLEELLPAKAHQRAYTTFLALYCDSRSGIWLKISLPSRVELIAEPQNSWVRPARAGA